MKPVEVYPSITVIFKQLASSYEKDEDLDQARSDTQEWAKISESECIYSEGILYGYSVTLDIDTSNSDFFEILASIMKIWSLKETVEYVSISWKKAEYVPSWKQEMEVEYLEYIG